ncbi:MAG: hypothetical protein IK136_00855, partial [Oscillospiraceae bacterium]|nr:hypothetical protein [Oscillospiraceae bacterium]
MTILRMSVHGAVLIVLVALVRLLFLRALPKRVFPLLWLVVLARLLIPFPSVLSLPVPLPQSGAASPAGIVSPVSDYAAPEAAAPAKSDSAPQASEPAPAQDHAKAPVPVWRLVWLSGALTAAACFAVLYILQYRRFRYAEDVKNDAAERWLQTHPLRRRLSVKALAAAASPLTCGVLRPVILVPETFGWESGDAAFALEHEYIHARRFHAAYKPLLALALAVHWCNPAVWLMYLLANRDLELSCDEAVLLTFGAERRGDYARALLSMEEKRRRIPSLCAGFGANTARERILAIMKYKKRSAACVVLAVLLLLAAAACSAVSPTAAEAPDAPASETPASAAPAPEWQTGETRRNSGLTFTVPGEFADMLLLDTPDGTGDHGTLFSVTDRRSFEDALKAHPGEDWGAGWVFAIGRVSEERLYDLLCADMSGVEVFARDGGGQYYLYLHPTDVRYERVYDDEAEARKGWEEWAALCEWGQTVQADFIRENGLTPYTRTNTLADIYLARVAAWPDMDVTLRYGDGEAFPARGVPGAESYAGALVRDVVFEGAD